MPQQDALKNLDKLRTLMPRLIQEAVNFTMLTAEREAKRTRAFQDRTGRLRNSIRAGLVQIDGQRIVGALTAGSNDANPGRGEAYTTASMLYAPFIELGTSRMRPRAFIWPAMQRIRGDRVFERAMRAQFRRIRF